jgi:hypothetical protein
VLNNAQLGQNVLVYLVTIQQLTSAEHAEYTAPDVKKPLKKAKTTLNSHSVMRQEKCALLVPLN